MVRVALVGASGRIGSHVMQELLDRGHEVTAIARDPERIADRPGVTRLKGDVRDGAGLTALLQGHDVIACSVPFSNVDPDVLIDSVRASGTRRFIVVGNVGNLWYAFEVPYLTRPEFPRDRLEEAGKSAVFLERLGDAGDLDWTFFSPSEDVVAGERTGEYYIARDAFLVGEQGSCISFEDYAKAFVDEIERPEHVRAQFTVGYVPLP